MEASAYGAGASCFIGRKDDTGETLEQAPMQAACFFASYVVVFLI